MDDLISRQAAIDALWEEPSYSDPLNVLTEARDRIKSLPSAERRGRWVKMDGTDLWCCSECGNTIYSEHETDRERFHKWCGRCGAKMEV